MEKEKLSAIVIKAKTGNTKALNALFTETYNDVYYFALKTVKDETLAADITQETFVTIFQNINNLNDPVAYPAWSRQITYRHCLQYLKKQTKETTVEENEDGSTIFDTIQEDREDFIPDKNLDKEDFKKTILDIVDGLPEEQRTAVILYYYDELSVKQIAEIQGVTEGTVKSRLNYARKAIKSSVEEYEKKNNIKLHSVGILPMLWWLFGTDAKACSLPTATATTIASNVSATTGTAISVSKLVQISSKLLGTLWQKIVAGVLAIAVVTGGTVAVVVKSNNENETVHKPITYVGETVQKNEDVELMPAFTYWEGYGEITTITPISNENQFNLQIHQMSEKEILGILSVYVANEFPYEPYEILIYGTGKTKMFNPNSVFYDVAFNIAEEIYSDDESKYLVERYSRDLSKYTEITLRYDKSKKIFEFVSGPYNAVLETPKIIDFFENQ